MHAQLIRISLWPEHTKFSSKQGFSLVGWYCMCQCNGETVEYLIHWEVAYALWSVGFRAFGIQ